MPSKLVSRSKLLRKVKEPPAAEIIIAGEVSSVLPMAAAAAANALFGAVSEPTGDVIHGTSAPLALDDQPAGNPGATTPSKFWSHPVAGVPLGVAVGVGVPPPP